MRCSGSERQALQLLDIDVGHGQLSPCAEMFGIAIALLRALQYGRGGIVDMLRPHRTSQASQSYHLRLAIHRALDRIVELTVISLCGGGVCLSRSGS